MRPYDLRCLIADRVVAFALLCFLLTMMLIYAADKRTLPAIDRTDYVAALYVAGHMVTTGHTEGLYPSLNAKTLWQQKFASYTCKLLPEADKSIMYNFTYPPVVALLTAPLSLFPPRLSLIIWQGICVVALFVSAYLFSKVPSVQISPLKPFLSSFLFFPLLNIFVVGQTSIVFGLLPLAAGYCLWQRGRYFLAGLCFAILSLKPQLMIGIVVIMLALFLFHLQNWLSRDAKPPKQSPQFMDMATGIFCGTLLLYSIALLYLGLDALLLWLHSLQISGAIFGRPETGYWQYHLYFSLPCVSIIALPHGWWQAARLPAYILGGATSVILICISAWLLRLRLSEETKRDMLMIIGINAVFLSAPHLLIYDTILLLLPAWIVFYKGNTNNLLLRSLFILGCFLFDIYMSILLTPGQYPTAVWQVILLLVISLTLVVYIWDLHKRSLQHAK